MAQYFTYVIDELAALQEIKKNFQKVTTKLKFDEAKMTEERVQDGKWYRVEVDDNVPCSPGDEEPTSLILTTNEEILALGQKEPETANEAALEGNKE
ncbi:hypothetical protein SESBI_30224 [Sesbania bispinosa]|nr:hypothetical protein SESBI_30224 [Sesbania bispinosa]